MTEFTLERRIPSCNVTKKCIQEVEEFLLSDVPQQTGLSPDEIRERYSISLRYTDGTERLNSISLYRHDMFEKNLQRIEMSINLWAKLTVELQFDPNPSFSRIRISYQSPQARAVVMGIYSGLERILGQHRNRNFFFHPPAFIDGILIGGLFNCISIYLDALKGQIKVSWLGISSAVIGTLILAYLGARWMKPYVAFDNETNRIKQKWADWFIGGLATFIIFGTVFPLIFGTVFPLIRKRLIGM